MSKTKNSGASHYEVLFIVSNRFTDEEAQVCVKKVEALIEANDGQITARNYWGKKKLAYPIKHEAYGYYDLLEFDLEPSKLMILDEKLRLDTEVIRFMIIKKPIKSDIQLAKEKKIKDKISSKKSVAVKAEEEEDETKNKNAKKKADLKSLDEKLEGILNAEDLL
jgi:small subunit ribosomal protein S6